MNPVLKDKDDELLKRDGVARLLKVSVRTVDKWMRDGKITPYYHGRELRFVKSECLGIFERPLIIRRRKTEQL